MTAFRAVGMIILVLGGLWVMGLRYHRTWSAPPSPGPSLFTERLGLAGEFSGPLPAGLETGLKSLALLLERDPCRREILRGGSVPAERELLLTLGYQLWSKHNQTLSSQVEGDLKVAAYEGLVRLLKVFGGLVALWVVVLSSALLGRTSSPTENRPQRVSLSRVSALFCAWLLLPFLFQRLTWDVWMTFAPLSRTLGSLILSYLAAGFLLGFFWRWNGWRPWRSVDWKLVGLGYLILLAFLPLMEVLTVRLTGLEPNVILSLAPVFRGRTSGEGALLVFMAVFLGPLVEELMFRGWLLLGLAGVTKPGFALVGSSFLFALCHGNIWGFTILFAFGLVTGWMTMRTGSLGSSLALHILWNATTLLFLAAVV